MNRTFGAALLGTGMTKKSDNMGLDVDNVRDIDISVYPYTAQTTTVTAWRTGLQASIDEVGMMSDSDRYEAHKSWWQSFWNRHWIMVSADGTDATDADMITRNYALSRFLLAAASGGEQSAHFNGLIFTVEVNKRLPHRFVTIGTPGKQYDADYRTWGSYHWFQNIRFAYWPMLIAGDAEHMHSLFDMYINALPLAQYRTDEYYDHDGAYFPETITGWGSHAPRDYGTAEARGENRPAGWLVQPHKRYHWEGNIELALMMRYYHDITQNDAWWTSKGLPFIHEIVTFFREHYSTDGGPIRITPSQGLETLRSDQENDEEIVNTTDKVAGLHFILDKLLALPEELTSEEQRTYWHGMKSQLPLIQKTVHNNKDIIASSESHSRPSQVKENVDLYATFPFPIYGVGKPDLQLARNTFDERRSNHMGGWNQQPVHAAMVGDLADAKNFTTRYFREKEMFGPSPPISQAAFRFPVFYGPSHDYIPNVPQMGNAMIGLQTMLVRYEGRRIILFPTWPDEWDVNFRVHLPYETVLQGELEDGEVVSLRANPSDRLEDIDYIRFESQPVDAPVVSLSAPVDGGVFGWGEAVDFTVAVTDTDSGGSTVEVDCADVSVVAQLVRGGTATDQGTHNGCSGTVAVVAEPSGAADDELLYRLVASYTDADSLTGTGEVTLHPRRKQAEHFDFESGVRVSGRTPSDSGYVSHFNNGEHFGFSPVNLSGVTSIDISFANQRDQGAAKIEVRAGSATGTLVGEVDAVVTGGWETWQTITANTVTDPGGTNDLYFVGVNTSSGLSGVGNVDWIQFNGGISTRSVNTRSTRSTKLSVDEGSTAVAALAATDEDTPAAKLIWSISGGDDASRFSLTEQGVLSLVAAEDFEAPGDRDGDGIYEVTVTVSDGVSSDTVDLVVTLADVNEAPTADGGGDQVGVAMGATVTLSGSASSDPDGGDTLAYGWSQTSGTAVALSATDTETVTFTAPSGLAEADTLVFALTVTDSQGLTDTGSVSVTVAGPGPVVASGPRARFELVPASHDGSSDFRFRVFFSEEVVLSFRDFTDGLFEVTGGSVRGARRLVSSSDIGWEVTAHPDGNDDVVLTIPGGRACSEPGAVCTSDDDPLAGTVTATVPRTAAEPAAPTARFELVPASHDGSSEFRFRVFFSEEVELSFRDFTGGLFEVTGGSVTHASRRTPGSNIGWDVTAVPDGDDNVYIVLAGDRACDEAGAVCNSDEDRLAATVTATVMGPQPSGGFLSSAGPSAPSVAGAFTVEVTDTNSQGATATTNCAEVSVAAHPVHDTTATGQSSRSGSVADLCFVAVNTASAGTRVGNAYWIQRYGDSGSERWTGAPPPGKLS